MKSWSPVMTPKPGMVDIVFIGCICHEDVFFFYKINIIFICDYKGFPCEASELVRDDRRLATALIDSAS